MPSNIDFSQFRPDPNAFQNAYDFANKMSQYAARQAAGRQYAVGDFAGAGGTLAKSGDIAGAETLAAKQADLVQKQQAALGTVGSFLDQAITADPASAQQAWQLGRQRLQSVGVKPETLAQLDQQYAANPKQTAALLGRLGARKLSVTTNEGVTRVIDETTGQLIHEYGATGPFRGTDIQAQALNIVLNPKSDPSARRAAEAVLSQGSTTATAGGILSKPGLGTSWLGAPGGEAAPSEGGGAIPAPAVSAPQTGGAPQAEVAPAPPPPETDQALPPLGDTSDIVAFREQYRQAHPGALRAEVERATEGYLAQRPVPDAGGAVAAAAPAPVSPPVRIPAAAQTPSTQAFPGGVTFTPFPQAAGKETWSNPVSEMRNGKPVRVQYSNLGNSRVVPDASPIPTASQSTAPTRQQIGLARIKLNSIGAIENQITRVQTAMDGAEKGGWTGYVYGRAPGEMIPSADVFDRAVAQLANLIRGLTRVPGEGSMSDYETRLAQLTLPSRVGTDEGRREAMAGIRDLTKQIKDGYTEMLSGTAPAATPLPAGGRRTIGRFQIEEGP